MPKNIVIFSDGTGQEGGEGHNTNIYKMFNMIEDRTTRQVAFYDRGLGTGWNKVTGLVGGMGVSRNIKQCYNFIFENFEIGDRLYLFGFSRGAATVRSLSSLIHYFGILPKSRPELIDKAYRIYKTGDPAVRKRRADEFVSKHRTIWTRIKFLGCYDTVAAFGLPYRGFDAILNMIPLFRHDFHNLTLSESVENACQALAIDDERKTFHPVLWDEGHLPYQTLRQVWFAGMHTDVGGGYEEHELSDIPLGWMIRKATDHGLLLNPDHTETVNPNPDGILHDSRGTFWTKLYRRQERFWPAHRKDRPVVHESVLKRTCDRHNRPSTPYRPWILNLPHEVESTDAIT